MTRWLAFTLVVCLFVQKETIAQTGQLPPLGQWRVHLSYQNLVDMASNGKEIAALGASGGFVFSTESNEYHYLNVQTGLSQTGLGFVEWDDTHLQWVLVYADGTLDLVKGKRVETLSDFKRFVANGNKTIHGLSIYKGKAFLSTGLGLVELDLSGTRKWSLYPIAQAPQTLAVHAYAQHQDFHYVATATGLLRAKPGSNLGQAGNWETISGQKGLPAGSFQQVGSWNKRLLVQSGKQLWTINDSTNWFPVLTDTSWDIPSVQMGGEKLLVTQKKGGNSRVLVLEAGGAISQTIGPSPQRTRIQKSLLHQQMVWLVDQESGLWKMGAPVENFSPNGPLGTPVGDVVSLENNTLVLASGQPQAQRNRNGLQLFSQENWSAINYRNNPLLDTLFAWKSLAYAPSDESLWAGSMGDGLVWKKGQTLAVFDARNSGLENSSKPQEGCLVAGLWVSAKNEVWASNPQTTLPLKLRLTNGNWAGFRPPFSLPQQGFDRILGDAAGNLWLTAPGLGLVAYHPGNSSPSASDDRWKLFQPGSGQGNLPHPDVYSVVADKDGSIWVGTGDGLALIVCNDQLFQGNACDAIIPVVQQGRFSGRLLQQETVLSLAVDGANRKWAGTRNGVYLLSPDGKQVLAHFTVQNSPLLSNEVQQIGILPQTGEVFFATPAGLSSFRSQATEANASMSLDVFPNPVPPGFSGLIGIRGLPENAWVKITELNGRLVAQMRSLGGQATWDGRDQSGKKVAAGVYLVLARGADGREKIATKIVKASND